MEREIYISFTDFDEHIDLSFLEDKDVSINLFVKGQLRANGKTVQKINSVNIRVTQKLPDEYDSRINALIEAIGGEDAVKALVEKYKARIAAITLGIPVRTGDTIEDGYISCEVMQKLCKLKLDVHFYYL